MVDVETMIDSVEDRLADLRGNIGRCNSDELVRICRECRAVVRLAEEYLTATEQEDLDL